MNFRRSNMNIVVINGSPRGMNGNTGILVNACVDALKVEGVNSSVINLGEVKIHGVDPPTVINNHGLAMKIEVAHQNDLAMIGRPYRLPLGGTQIHSGMWTSRFTI